ncbi:MAG: ABC transporter substrate-binding protein [Alphaproteobacteria bacterium]|nr:ABC transporter substrate-binding protein [Alphaproteobacteria bacterium]
MINKTTSRIILMMTLIVISIIIYLINSESFIQYDKSIPTNQIALGKKGNITKSEGRKRVKKLAQEKSLPDIGKSLKEKQVIKIGVSLPLSGEKEITGDALRSALYMAYNEIPENTKFKYEIIIEDSGKEKTFMSTYTLVDVKDVDALLSVYEDAEIVAKIAEKNKLPHIACAWNEHFLEKKSHSFNHFPSYNKQADSFLDNLERNNIRIFSIVNVKQEPYKSLAKEVKKQALKRNFVVQSVFEIEEGQLNFSKEIGELSEKTPEAVLVLMGQREGGIFTSKLNSKALSFRYTDIDMMREINKTTMNGALYVLSSRGDYLFREKFIKASVLPLPVCAPNLYDAVKMLVVAFESTDKKIRPRSDVLLKSLSQISNFSSATGDVVSVGKDRIIESSLEAAEIYDNRIYYQNE